MTLACGDVRVFQESGLTKCRCACGLVSLNTEGDLPADAETRMAVLHDKWIATSTQCEKCGEWLRVGDYPFCPHGQGINGAIGDECDVWQENGFRTPQHFTSKKERLRALAEKGLEERVCNAGVHDVLVPRWSMMDPQTMKNAEALAMRHGATKGRGPEAPDPAHTPVSWNIRELES